MSFKSLTKVTMAALAFSLAASNAGADSLKEHKRDNKPVAPQKKAELTDKSLEQVNGGASKLKTKDKGNSAPKPAGYDMMLGKKI